MEWTPAAEVDAHQEALRIQVAVVAAQQAALLDEEARLQQQQTALNQQLIDAKFRRRFFHEKKVARTHSHMCNLYKFFLTKRLTRYLRCFPQYYAHEC